MPALQPFDVRCPSCEEPVRIFPKVKTVERRENDLVVTIGNITGLHRCTGSGKFPHPRAAD